MCSSNLISGAECIVQAEGGEVVRGRIENIGFDTLEFKPFPPFSFFPFACKSFETFVREGERWKRVFPDPFTGKRCFSQREPLYSLSFCH